MPRIVLQEIIPQLSKNRTAVFILIIIGFIVLAITKLIPPLGMYSPYLSILDFVLVAIAVFIEIDKKIKGKNSDLNKYHGIKMTNEDKRETELKKSPIMDILADSTKANFISIKRDTPKSPLEIIKQTPKEDEVLPMLANMTKFDSIDVQIKYARQGHWIDIYSDSWAEREVQLIGFHLLEEIERIIDRFTDLYDAGCANFGQFKALMALKQRNENIIDKDFKYFAQDYIPEWEQKFHIENGMFFPIPLPSISTDQDLVTLVSCTHTLHFMERFPIAIYSSIFSFNKLLKKNGYCYITVPEKDNQPGMLDLLEKAAIDAGFIIIKSGKKRLIHKLKEKPFNVTTFLYLIIQKQNEIVDSKWKELLKASFFRAGYKAPEQFRIDEESEINNNIIILEEYLNEIFNERNPFLRTFLFALDTINNECKGKIPNVEKCKKNIKKQIDTLHDLIIDTQVINREAKLQSECGCYFYWLVEFYTNKGTTLKVIVNSIYPIVKQVFNDAEDIRVHDNLTNKEVARLLKHLFETCQYENIDIKEAFNER